MVSLKNLIVVSMLGVVGVVSAATCPALNSNSVAPEGYTGGVGTAQGFYSVEIEPGFNRITCIYQGSKEKIAGSIFDVSAYNYIGPAWTHTSTGYACGVNGGGSIDSCQFTVNNN